MKKVKYLILGAGPSGLTFANRLIDLGEESYLVIEKESQAGGLCRSMKVDGTALDIGGGHFLDVRRPEVNEYLFRFMPEEEWNRFERDSRININNMEIHHPIEANIWEMDIDNQVEYLKSIAMAGCVIGVDQPEQFVEWIYWKLGKRIAQDYMIPYNKKMFGDELNELGTYWLDKLPNVSFEDTLRSCLTQKAYGEQPGHSSFYYPKKYGYGELWLRMAERLKNNIIYQSRVKGIDFEKKQITLMSGEVYQADIIITTIPWHEFESLLGMPKKLQDKVKELKSSSVEIRYFADEILDRKVQWIYYPDEQLPYHRILVRQNFCTDSRGYWTETNGNRVSMFNNPAVFVYLNEYAYPINTINKNEYMDEILKWAAQRNVFGLGRWGEHQHYNSDVTVLKALQLVEKICV